MCCHAALADLINPQFRTESQESMKCAPRFEGPDFLEVFALEVKSKDWRRGFLAFKGRAVECGFLLGCRSNVVESF